jgi:4-amino-4-deoxy-L-arabinose transferase-like glycosyltransferase
MIPPFLSKHIGLIALAAACFIGFWLSPHSLGITDLDEGLYASAAREMALTSDWVTPRVNGRPFFEKPPLLYWLSAASIRAFGPTERAVRLPSAMAATLTVIFVYAFGCLYLDRRSALLGAAALALAPLSIASARLATTDATLVLLVTCTLSCAYHASHRGHGASVAWSLAAWLCAALGTLAKGAPGFVLPVLILALHALLIRHVGVAALGRSILRVRHLIGLMLFMAVVAPWHIAAWHANGGPFVEEYIVRQHIGRFRGGDTAHHAPVWFYVPGFLAGFFPWSVFAAASLWPVRRRDELDREDAGRRSEVLRFLKIWFAVVFLLFSAGGSKLISYILPLYPAAALLAGDWLIHACSRPRANRTVAAGALAALAVALVLLACLLVPGPVVALINRYADRPVEIRSVPSEAIGLAVWLAGIVAVGMLATAGLALRNRGWLTPVAMGATMAAFVVALLYLGVPLAQSRMVGTLHEAASRAGALAGRSGSITVALRGPRRPSVLFYMPDGVIRGHRVAEVDANASHPLSAALTDAALRLRSSGPRLAIVDSGAIGEIEAGLRYPTPWRIAVVTDDGRYAVVRLEPVAASGS